MAKAALARSCLSLATLLAGLQMTACVGQPPPKDPVCRLGATLVCVERMGKVHKCTCQSKESMQDILEPNKL